MTERKMTEEETAADYLANPDPDEVFEKPVVHKVYAKRQGPRSSSTMFSMRISAEELTRIAEYAQSHDMSVADFLRKSAQAVMANEVALLDEATYKVHALVKAKVQELNEAVGQLQ